MTFIETHIVIEAMTWVYDRRHRENAWLAWHTAALSRAKRLPSLSSLTSEKDAKPLYGKELAARKSEFASLQSKVNEWAIKRN